MNNSRKQFDIQNGIITKIKPYEIIAIIVNKLKIYGEGNTRNEVANSYIPMHWYASSKEEAEIIKNQILEEIPQETIDGDIMIRHFPTVVIDIKAKRIQKDAGTNKGIERVVIYDGTPQIDSGAFDENTNIINIISRPKTKKRFKR